MMKNWAQAPIKMSNGLCAKMRKSAVVKVRPIVNMMMPKITVCVFPLTQSKAEGTKKVNIAAAITTHEALLANHLLRFCKELIVYHLVTSKPKRTLSYSLLTSPITSSV